MSRIAAFIEGPPVEFELRPLHVEVKFEFAGPVRCMRYVTLSAAIGCGDLLAFLYEQRLLGNPITLRVEADTGHPFGFKTLGGPIHKDSITVKYGSDEIEFTAEINQWTPAECKEPEKVTA